MEMRELNQDFAKISHKEFDFNQKVFVLILGHSLRGLIKSKSLILT